MRAGVCIRVGAGVQMYAQRYGTVPVVHDTGGLRDSVQAYDPAPAGLGVARDEGTGWRFERCDAASLRGALWAALNTYRARPEAWAALSRRCMEQDFSWRRSAARYVEIFRAARRDPPHQVPQQLFVK